MVGEDFRVKWVFAALIVAVFGLTVVATYALHDQCKSEGGHVVVTFLYFQTIVGPNGSVSLIPINDYKCVVP